MAPKKLLKKVENGFEENMDVDTPTDEAWASSADGVKLSKEKFSFDNPKGAPIHPVIRGRKRKSDLSEREKNKSPSIRNPIPKPIKSRTATPSEADTLESREEEKAKATPLEETPEEKHRGKNAEKKAARKSKTTATKATEKMSVEDKPVSKESEKKSKIKEPEKPRIVTAFRRAMRSGYYMLATKCHAGDPEIGREGFIRKWTDVRAKQGGGRLPEIKAVLVFGKEIAIEFNSAEDANAVEGEKFENGSGHWIHLKRNMVATAIIFSIRKASLSSADDVMSAFKKKFLVDNFRLYQGLISGIGTHDWAAEFLELPYTTIRTVEIPETEVEGKGAWSC
ncbi:MAG: hypothetical protein M1834_005651 [Cirrosporium novae-zelandiae]|nr:MAG: hypothetical protein M1834_005651 [Cirrosporium novae-zelandiae]